MRRFGVVLLSAIMVTSRPQDGATPGRGAIRFGRPNSRDLAGLSGLPYGDAAPSHDHDSLLPLEDDEVVRLSLPPALNPSGRFAVLPARNGPPPLRVPDGHPAHA